MKTVAMQARLGITAIAALTILTLPTWAQEKGGQGRVIATVPHMLSRYP